MSGNERSGLGQGDKKVFDFDYIIPTPAISEFYDTVTKWIHSKATGGMVTGMQRFGKTAAIEYFMKKKGRRKAKRSP